MIKLLINIVALVLCAVIIVLGGIQTFKQSNFGAIKADAGVIAMKWQEAIAELKTPVSPDDGGDGETDNPGDGGEIEDDVNPDVGGGSGGQGQPGDNDDNTGEGGSSDVVETPVDKQAMTDLYDNYNESTAELSKEILADTLTSNLDTDSDEGALAADFVISYVDNLYSAIDDSIKGTENMTDEEAEQAKAEFIEKETAALDGMMGLVGSMNGEEGPTEEQLEKAVDTILDSTVVSNTIKENAETIDEESKNELQNALQSAIDSVNGDVELGASEKEDLVDRYKGIAGLFGIELN